VFALHISVLGELGVSRGGAPVPLPPSRKARALLGWLALTGRAHRREALCELLWDVADDPRAALRWCLTHLRAVVDTPDHRRLLATRADVALDRADLSIDLHEASATIASGLHALDTAALQALSGRFRGELLEGLELPDFHDFQLWLAAQRDEARTLHLAVLDALAHGDDRAAALSAARQRVQLEPLDERGRAHLVRLLLSAGRRYEAQQQLDVGRRQLRTFDVKLSGELATAWRETLPAPESSPPPVVTDPRPGEAPLVGRDVLLAQIEEVLAKASARRTGRLIALRGDLGIGKTRVLEAVAARAAAGGWHVVAVSARELDLRRALGVWDPLIVEGSDDPGTDDRPRMDDGSVQIRAVIAQLVAAAAGRPLAVIVDDAHWLDGASLALLRLLMAVPPEAGCIALMAAREGDLDDHRELRELLTAGTSHARVWSVGPLTPDEILEVARTAAPDAAERIAAASAGVPLYALELARARLQDPEQVPATVTGAIRRRVERLGEEPWELASWCSVLGNPVPSALIAAVTGWDTARLVRVMERLERHRVLVPLADGETWRFSHDLVRSALYSELSPPRRRLMHARVLDTLEQQAKQDPAFAAALARHAGLAGDHARAAWACAIQARRNLAMGAPVEAAAVARRGLRHAAALPEREGIIRRVALLAVLVRARDWANGDALIASLEETAERALEHGLIAQAREAVMRAAELRWLGSDYDATVRLTRRIEEIARSGGPAEQAHGLLDAARCLVFSEFELPRAAGLLREVELLGERHEVQLPNLTLVQGTLCRHAGEDARALSLLGQSRGLMSQRGDPLGEFSALEQTLLLHLDQRSADPAARTAVALVEVASRMPPGSEQPYADALEALARRLRGEPADLDRALASLERADASHRLAQVLVLASAAATDGAEALSLAERALVQADRLRRPNMVALALAAVHVARGAGCDIEGGALRRDVGGPWDPRTQELPLELLSAPARRALAAAGLPREVNS
jgi:DNA-binding SARP family transcriptional activator